MCCTLLDSVFKTLYYIFAGFVVVTVVSYLFGYTMSINCGNENSSEAFFCKAELMTNYGFTSFNKCVYFNNYQLCVFSYGKKIGINFQQIPQSFGF